MAETVSTPLVTGPVRTEPVHILRIEAVWYCGDKCEGHDTAVPDSEAEVSYVLEHLDCPPPPCCCTWDANQRLDSLLLLPAPTYPQRNIDPECAAGNHDECLNRPRCATEQMLNDWGLDTYELPQTTGVYRIQAWFDGPDYWGEYDEGIEHEPLEAVACDG